MTTSEYAGRRIVVAGLGVTGRAVTRVLLDLGAGVTVVSDAAAGGGEPAAAGELRGWGADVRVGSAAVPAGTDLLVTSPGLRPAHPLLAAAARGGVEVIGEPELAWRLRPPGAGPWLGITGTNGKTTTVGMLEAILAAAGRRVVAAGNVGVPLVEVVRGDPRYDVLAVEISSAQLTFAPSLRFEVAAVLNIAEDHLDWHVDFDDYVAAKARAWRDAVAVGNADDPVVRRVLPTGARTFSVRAAADYYRDGDALREAATGTVLAAIGDLAVDGEHNLANALAAAAVARSAGVGADAVAAGLRTFRPGRHRNEVVAHGGDVTWVDDSKATNPHAAAASLGSYPSVVWIAGGLLKGADVDPLVREQAGRLRAVVLLGRDRQRFAEALARHAPDVPVTAVEATDTGAMDDAVATAAQLARPGDTVLLAPAAASWDMFRDYAERGDRFSAAARRQATAARS